MSCAQAILAARGLAQSTPEGVPPTEAPGATVPQASSATDDPAAPDQAAPGKAAPVPAVVGPGAPVPTAVGPGAPIPATAGPGAPVPAATPAPAAPLEQDAASVTPPSQDRIADTPPDGASIESDLADRRSTVVEDPYPRITPSARVMAGAELVRSHPVEGQVEIDSRQPFFLQQARVKLRADLHKRIRLSLSADLNAKLPVRSAFAHFRLKRALQIRIGRFKRPMSRTELTGVGELPFNERGIFNQRLIEAGAWGDRALGVMLRGKFKYPKLQYWAAIMNSAPNVNLDRVERLRGADVLGRLQYSPVKPVKIAINGGHKITEKFIDGPDVGLNAFGGDVQLALGGLSITLESIAAQNLRPPTPPDSSTREPWALMALAYADYRIDLGGGFTLQPTVLAEWVDTDLDVAQDETLRLLVGCNLLWNEKTRIMPQVTVQRPLGEVGERSQTRAESYTLVVSVEL